MSEQAKSPKWADASAIGGMKERSLALVNTVKEKSGPALLRAVDVIGAGSQKKMSEANDLMSTSVNSLLKGLDG